MSDSDEPIILSVAATSLACKRVALDSTALCNALVTLARSDIAGVDRESAARSLINQLRVVAATLFRSKFRNLRVSDAEELLQDAVQHTAFVACMGRARFRGCSPPQAVRWCVRVLSNFVFAELRRLQFLNEGELHLRDYPSGADSSDPSFPVVFEDALQAHLKRAERRGTGASLYQAVCCYLEYLAGVPFGRQLERWVHGNTPPCHQAHRRARNRLYQYRHRGRVALAEVLKHEAW